jgi:hypothetical protein
VRARKKVIGAGEFAPMLGMLKETVESADWVQNQLALRIFVWIADMYKGGGRERSRLTNVIGVGPMWGPSVPVRSYLVNPDPQLC